MKTCFRSDFCNDTYHISFWFAVSFVGANAVPSYPPSFSHFSLPIPLGGCVLFVKDGK